MAPRAFRPSLLLFNVFRRSYTDLTNTKQETLGYLENFEAI